MIEKDPSRATISGHAYVTLREFEQRMQEIKDLIDNAAVHERELRKGREESVEKAYRLSQLEVERRLGELNHAHAQAMENWARTLPRELFDAWLRDFDKWKETVSAALVSSAPQREYIRGVDLRVSAMEKMANKITGAFVLLGVMGMLGVMAFVLGLARLAGLLK